MADTYIVGTWWIFKRESAFARWARIIVTVGLVVAGLAYALGWRAGAQPASAAGVPINELQTPPADAQQLIVVSADDDGQNTATLQAFERDGAGWKSVFGPLDAHVGLKGFSANRHEGDKTTPSGTFRLTEAFGIKTNPGTLLPYRVVGRDDWWISDSSKPEIYNTWQTHADPVPWDRSRAEHLIDFKPSYNHAVVVDFNRPPTMELGKGSAIFLHVDNGKPTSGCVAIDEARLADIMRWLDPPKRPYIMMGTLAQLLKVKAPPPVAAGPSGGLQQVTPTRVLDTRAGTGAPKGPLAARTTLDLTVTGGAAQVPADAVAVALNVTLTEQSQSTYLTVYPAPADATEGPPLVSNVNAVAGEHRANLVVVRVGAGGRVRIYNPFGTAHVVADLVGYVMPTSAGRFQPVTPYRVLDTRFGTGVANTGKIGPPDAPLDVTLPFVPEGATAVVVNVTVTEPTQATWIAAYGGGTKWPGTSSVNSSRDETSANLAVVPLGEGHSIRLQNANGAAHVVVDVQGFVTPTGSVFTAATTPVRVLDTRDGVGARGRLKAGGVIFVDMPGLPAGTTAVAVTITAVSPSDNTFIRATATDDKLSQTSNVNVGRDATRANLAIVPVGTDGRIALTTNSGDVHVVVDVSGWFVGT